MNTYKKIVLGLGFLITLLGLFSLVSHQRAYAATTYTWKGSDSAGYTISSSDGVTFQQIPGSNNFEFINQANNGTCEATAIIRVNSAGGSGTLYPLSSNADARSRAGLDSVDPYSLAQFLQNPSKCKGPGSADVTTIRIAGTPPSSVNPNGFINPTVNTPNGSAAPSCETNYKSAFKWVMCPALELVDSAMGSMNSFVEDQLIFKTCTTTSNPNPSASCGNSLLSPQVEAAWAIFRNIATALIVIVLLVALIAQAVGGVGFLDAYALRKMLPKIVAAVILIQISFVACRWAIDLSNDLGTGIKDLLFAPFGGNANMSLDHLVGSAVNGLDTTSTTTFSLFVAIGGTVALVSSLPALLSLGLFAVLALLTAFVVLLLRRLLILLLVIMVPIALILWILPGTEQYWKKWQQNFTKLLMMFPLIMAMIAAGRIFAYVTTNAGVAFLPIHIGVAHLGPLPVPYVATATDFVSLAIVIFAYFAPYFLLPKTFSMGGTMMASAANAVQKRVTEPLNKRGQEGVKGISERYHGNMGNKYNPDAGIGGRIFRRVGSGHYLPTKRSQRLAIGEGDKFAAARNEEAAALAGRTYNKALENGYDRTVRTEDGQEAIIRRNAAGEMVDAAGNVTTERGEALVPVAAGHGEREHLTGVAAGKQALVELAHSSDERVAKGAIKQLIDTSSWPEIQAARDNNGNRVFENNPHWNTALSQSPEHYSKVLRARADLAPHVLEIADRRTRVAEEEAVRAGGPAWTQQERQSYHAAARMQYAIESQMSNEDFATQSQGFWQDANLLSAGPHGAGIQGTLRNRFEAIHATGVPGQQILGHLNGGEIQGEVDRVLGGAGLSEYIGVRTTPPPPPATPGEISIQHAQNIAQNLPSDAAIAAGSAGREAFKVQVRTDPAVAQTLAHGIAYGVASAEHVSALGEVRNELSAVINNATTIISNPASTAHERTVAQTQIDNAKNTWNSVADQLQQAHQQRINDQVTAAAARGYNPARHRDRAQERIAPEIVGLEANSPAPVTGPDLRKFA